MKTFFCFIGHPSRQFWLVRVRKEFKPFIQSVLNQSLFEKKPLFTTPFAKLFFAEGKKQNNPDILVKYIQAQIAADYIRRTVFCQAKREYLSSQNMLELGLKCPMPIGYAINLNPFSIFDSFLICEYIPDAVHISQHLRELNEFERLMYLKMVARDISTMFASNVIHKDLHLKNILLSPADPSNIYWIDNDLRKTGRRKIMKHKEAMLHRLMVNIPFCSDKEKKYFIDEIFYLFSDKKHGGLDG